MARETTTDNTTAVELNNTLTARLRARARASSNHYSLGRPFWSDSECQNQSAEIQKMIMPKYGKRNKRNGKTKVPKKQKGRKHHN